MRAQRGDALPRNIIAVRRNMDYQRLLSNNNNNYPTHHREYPTISCPYSLRGVIIFDSSTPTEDTARYLPASSKRRKKRKITFIISSLSYTRMTIGCPIICLAIKKRISSYGETRLLREKERERESFIFYRRVFNPSALSLPMSDATYRKSKEKESYVQTGMRKYVFHLANSAVRGRRRLTRTSSEMTHRDVSHRISLNLFFAVGGICMRNILRF